MEPLADLLRCANRPVFTMDLPGHGDLAQTTTAACQMDAVVAEVLDTVALLGENVHLCGYSMGGRVALSVAATDPSRLASVATIGASPGLRSGAERAERRDADESLADQIEAKGLAWFVAYWEQLPFFASQRTRLDDLTFERQRRQRLAQRAQGLAASLRGTGTGAMAPLHDALGELAVPLLAMAGADDLKFVAVAGELAGMAPEGRANIVPDAGHAAHLEQPEAVATALNGFWNAVDGATPDATKP